MIERIFPTSISLTTIGLRPYDLPILVASSLYFCLDNAERLLLDRRLLTLALRKLKVTTPFDHWPQIMYSKNFIEMIQLYPTSWAIGLQIVSLVNKVIAAAAFYLTINISLYTCLTNLLSLSEKASKIAQPILDKTASLPIPYLLKSRVIVFAPVIVKLIQMALIYFDPTNKYKVLKLLKTGTNKMSQGLEILWNLRFTILCLGISEKVYRLIALTICSHLLKYLKLGLSMQQLFNAVFIFANSNIGPAIGLNLGLASLWNSMQDFSDLLDFETIKKRFEEANKSSQKIVKHNLSELEDNLYIRLTNFISDSNFKNNIENPEIQEQIKKWYCEPFGVNFDEFCALLKELNQTPSSIQDLISFSSNLDLSKIEQLLLQEDPRMKKIEELFTSASTQVLGAACEQARKISVKNSYKIFSSQWAKTIKCNPINFSKSNLSNCLTYLNDLDRILQGVERGYSGKLIRELRIDVLRQIIASYPNALSLEDLQDSRYAEPLMELFKQNGVLHKFAVTEESRYAAYLKSAQFHLKRLELVLQWYLLQPPTLREKEGEKIEYSLFHFVKQASFNEQEIVRSPNFACWKNQSCGKSKNRDVKTFLQQSNASAFEFARNNLKIPQEFKFKTITLPGALNTLKSWVITGENLWVPLKQFPEPWCQKTWNKSLESEFSKACEKEILRLDALYKKQHPKNQ